ncbi:hypothetical protein CRYUN_Cryun22dG0106100 [Craigia yunnanensis]
MAYALVAVLVLAICHNKAKGVAPAASHGITAPAVLPSTAAREFLEAYNQARAAVGVGPLKWSEQLANATSRLARYQRNKMGCPFANLTDHKCGVYKQVVWKNSSDLGCAQATCKDQISLSICFYNPPGNFVGERPY